MHFCSLFLSLFSLLSLSSAQLTSLSNTLNSTLNSTITSAYSGISSVSDTGNTITTYLPPVPTLPPIMQSPNITERIENQYIVLLKPNSTLEAQNGLIQQLQSLQGFNLLHTYESAVNGFAFNVSSSVINNALSVLQNSPFVSLIEQDSLRNVFINTQQNSIWSLDRVDQRSPRLDGLYHYNTTANNVNVYVIDTGIRRTHIQFQNRAKVGTDAVTSGGDASDCHVSLH